jgi:integrase
VWLLKLLAELNHRRWFSATDINTDLGGAGACQLAARLRHASGTYRLFPVHRSTAFLHFRKAAAAIGLHPDLRHPHVLRHSTAHWMLAGGAPLNATSQYLGHTSLASTAAYLNVSDAVASAAAASVIGTL